MLPLGDGLWIGSLWLTGEQVLQLSVFEQEILRILLNLLLFFSNSLLFLIFLSLLYLVVLNDLLHGLSLTLIISVCQERAKSLAGCGLLLKHSLGFTALPFN